ncbi:threonylcarbamoyl-AMP synthase [Clostridium sporogenes]|nr:threonylcarbamoyl-AMP synthase [Clostridium sporogenes]NFS24179.1 threonylcarbamoyl-AMP synthase [Clostridium sporogenes]
METKVVRLDENNIDEYIISEAGNILRQGGLVVFPTETVYGLGANALDKNAVKKIFEAKGRPQDNPLIVHISKINDIDNLVEEISPIAKKIMDKFWPGPITIILKKKDIIPNETSAGLDSIGIRMPSNKIAMKIISMAGVPVAAPSANLSGKPSPTDVETCINDLYGKVDAILGGDSSEVGVESTVIDCTINPPCILRPGGITLEMLQEVDSDIYIDPAIMKKPEKNLRPKAPGMKYRHYAPKAPLKIIKGDLNKTIEKINEMVQNYIDEKKKVGIIATDETICNYKNGEVISIGSRNDLGTVAHNLFHVLRKFDEKNVDLILSESFEEKDMGVAIMNRLKKSAGYDIINLD